MSSNSLEDHFTISLESDLLKHASLMMDMHLMTHLVFQCCSGHTHLREGIVTHTLHPHYHTMMATLLL